MKRLKLTLTTLVVVASVTGCGASPSTEPTPIDAAERLTLVKDARHLNAALATYRSTNGTYPKMSAELVAQETDAHLSKNNYVRLYGLLDHGVLFCIANTTTGGWARMDTNTGTILTSGSTLCNEPKE